jgi:hypothetical protein
VPGTRGIALDLDDLRAADATDCDVDDFDPSEDEVADEFRSPVSAVAVAHAAQNPVAIAPIPNATVNASLPTAARGLSEQEQMSDICHHLNRGDLDPI